MTLQRIMLSLKRMLLLRPRHRSLLRSAAAVSLSVSAVLFLSSAFLLDDSDPLPRPSPNTPPPATTPPPAATPSSLALQLTQSPPQQDPKKDLKDELPSQVTSDESDFFNPYKGKVIERKVVKKISGEKKKKKVGSIDKKVESADKKGYAGAGGGRDPAFGFVNKDFRSPYDPQARNPIVETFENFVNGQYGINPGTLLGAVAALRQSKGSNNDGERTRTSDRGRSGEERLGMRDGEGIGSSKEEVNGTMRGGASGGKDLRGGSSSDKATRGPPVRPRKENNGAQGSKQNILGSLLTQIGPSILEGALSKVAHNGRGNPEGQQTQGSPLTTLFSQVGPSLLSGFLQNGKGPSARGNGGSESSPLQSIMSGLGPVLLAGAVSQGLGGNGRDKDAQSPIQSMISNLGPQLMSSVIKQGLGAGKGRSQDPGPVESIISGLGPLLGKAVQSSFQGDSGKSPVVSILSGLGSNLLSGMTKNGQDKNRYNGFPQHSPPQVRGPNPQVPPRTRQRTDSSNASLPRTPSAGSPNFREGESPRQEPEGLKEVQLSAGGGEQEHQARTEDDNTAAAQPPLLRLAAGSLLEWLPDRLSVPQANSTRGAWEMAVNLALGNPKEQQGRKSQFWSWMRQLSGSDQQSSPRAATWILQALGNPARTAHAQAISDFYDAMARVQPICQAMETVGGLYNWKKDVLEGSRVVCMDPDVTPKKKDCVVYSFGVQNEWSFEEEMDRFGCEVWAFDPSMTTGNHNHSEHIHFYNIGLAASNTTRHVHGQTWNLFTYPAVVEKLGHSKTAVSYLNLEAAGSEWEVLQEAMQDNPHILTNVHQLGVRVHLDLALKDPALYQVNLNTLRDLESYGFQLFSSGQEDTKENIYFDPLLKRTVSLTYDLVFLRI